MGEAAKVLDDIRTHLVHRVIETQEMSDSVAVVTVSSDDLPGVAGSWTRSWTPAS